MKNIKLIVIALLVVFFAIPAVGSDIFEGGLTEIIDKDDAEVAAGEYSDSVGISFSAYKVTGEITQIVLVASELGAGAILGTAGTVFIFDTDPAVTAGSAALAAAGAEHKTVIGTVAVATGDWDADTAGAVATVYCSVMFHKASKLYFAFKPAAGATAINSDAGDDEELHLNFWYVVN